ncbi:hypothetical protein BLOT_014751 [Blomia tropicalis]|nr:hypothetical protein BLOT_014751 [Blomia tropicalis]
MERGMAPSANCPTVNPHCQQQQLSFNLELYLDIDILLHSVAGNSDDLLDNLSSISLESNCFYRNQLVNYREFSVICFPYS